MAAPRVSTASVVRCRVVEYAVDTQNLNLSAIRTIRVLRPLRAINRIPSESLRALHSALCSRIFNTLWRMKVVLAFHTITVANV